MRPIREKETHQESDTKKVRERLAPVCVVETDLNIFKIYIYTEQKKGGMPWGIDTATAKLFRQCLGRHLLRYVTFFFKPRRAAPEDGAGLSSRLNPWHPKASEI